MARKSFKSLPAKSQRAAFAKLKKAHKLWRKNASGNRVKNAPKKLKKYKFGSVPSSSRQGGPA